MKSARYREKLHDEGVLCVVGSLNRGVESIFGVVDVEELHRNLVPIGIWGVLTLKMYDTKLPVGEVVCIRMKSREDVKLLIGERFKRGDLTFEIIGIEK